jgi:hypothetical protein
VSIDRRLRRDLERDAERIHIDVERNLGAVQARARPRGVSTWLPAVGAAVVLVAIAVRFGTPAPVAGPSVEPSPSGGIASRDAGFAAIAGTYRVSLETGAETPSVSGTWSMRLVDDGEVALTPPATFAGASLAPTGVSFSVSGDRLRTDLFYNDYCRSIGTYTWALASDRLTLVPVDDECAIRRALLGTLPWTRLP